jgi:2-polyprenyl-3-methyl-5-hydroxy-6-metoxy-1,4-benzoquinol methylase
MSQMLAHLGKHLHKVVDAFENGGGVPYSEFRPEFTDVVDSIGRRRYSELLINGYLPAADGLQEQLREGIRVADIGCGTGHCMNIMAREYPGSTFVGYDIAEDAIARGNVEAEQGGLVNARFEVLDVTKLPSEPKFDLITAFDAIHDQVDPATVLRRVSDALAHDGTFLMIDIKASSNVEENVGNPLAPMLYGISVMHCMTVSLAHNGAALGTVWGEQLARGMLADAGFTSVEVTEAPDPLNSIYVCRK